MYGGISPAAAASLNTWRRSRSDMHYLTGDLPFDLSSHVALGRTHRPIIRDHFRADADGFAGASTRSSTFESGIANARPSRMSRTVRRAGGGTAIGPFFVPRPKLPARLR